MRGNIATAAFLTLHSPLQSLSLLFTKKLQMMPTPISKKPRIEIEIVASKLLPADSSSSTSLSMTTPPEASTANIGSFDHGCLILNDEDQNYDRTGISAPSSAELTFLCNVISSVCALDTCYAEEGDVSELVNEATCLLNELSTRAKEHLPSTDDAEGNNSENPISKRDANANDTRPTSIASDILAQRALLAAKSLRELMAHWGPARGKSRKILLATVSVLEEQTPSKILAVIAIVAALSLNSGDVSCDEEHRSISRAAVSGVLPNGRYKSGADSKGSDLDSTTSVVANSFGGKAVLALLEIAASPTSSTGQTESGTKIDLHIVTYLARAFVSNSTPLLASTCATVARQKLCLPEGDAFDDNTARPEVGKIDAAGALGLAAQIGPWATISPISLVDVSVDMHLWDAAQRVCDSAIRFDSLDVHEAVHALVDSASDRRMYRQADAFATEFYETGGRSRYAEARFMHACDTIAKVVLKRQYPILERQVLRVDKAYERVQRDCAESQVTSEEESIRNGKEDVRNFALARLREVSEHDTAHRLATLWDIEYWYNEADAEKYAEARRERYLQWDEAIPDLASSIPDVISNPNELTDAFKELEATIDGTHPVVGFDVEWGEDCAGAALLQLSTTKMSILIDIPALSETLEGCNSLAGTVGQLFAGNTSTVAAGFSCREDRTRLHSSPGVREKHWLVNFNAVVDIKPLIAEDTPKLKHLGLSRVCEHYLGKPMDKAEQCSLWARRPLSIQQRAYAALDAWAVAAIYAKLPIQITKPKMEEELL